MKNLLSELFKHSIELGEFNKTENKWLGNGTLTSEEIEEFEKKLNVIFPLDYKELLILSNGFPAPTGIDPSFLKVENIKYLRDYNIFDLQQWNLSEFRSEYDLLKRSILIGGINEEQQFLIVPPLKNEDWLYFHFANWNPGIEKYTNLTDYFESVIEFMSEEIKTRNNTN